MSSSAFELLLGDCLETMATLPDASVEAVVTDPPYGLEFMGNEWDRLDGAGVEESSTSAGGAGAYSRSRIRYGREPGPAMQTWHEGWLREALRVLRPGGHIIAFSATRTYHRLAAAAEDVGFEVRDMLGWLYGSGFPKYHSVSRAIDGLDAVKARRERALEFTAWMRSTGVTREELDAATASNMGSHYLTASEQPAVPTQVMFDRMRPLLPDPPERILELVRERTIESENVKNRPKVGTRRAQDLRCSRPVPVAAQGIAVTPRRELDITDPATDEARLWDGWTTALKPALEPCLLGRKPFKWSTAENVLEHGTGALNVGGCRIPSPDANLSSVQRSQTASDGDTVTLNIPGHTQDTYHRDGRYPANILHDGSGEVIELLGEAARFFFSAKAAKAEKNAGCNGLEVRQAVGGGGIANASAAGAYGSVKAPGRNHHPTVKPLSLMRYLCRMVTPPGGTVLDPFTGSGSTGIAALREGFGFIGCERSEEYLEIARARITHAVTFRPSSSDRREGGQLEIEFG